MGLITSSGSVARIDILGEEGNAHEFSARPWLEAVFTQPFERPNHSEDTCPRRRRSPPTPRHVPRWRPHRVRSPRRSFAPHPSRSSGMPEMQTEMWESRNQMTIRRRIDCVNYVEHLPFPCLLLLLSSTYLCWLVTHDLRRTTILNAVVSSCDCHHHFAGWSAGAGQGEEQGDDEDL